MRRSIIESRARIAWFYWWSSLIWAVPITFILCVAGTGLTLTIAYALGGDEHSASEYVSTALVGFFLWGTVVFVGTCWFLIPLVISPVDDGGVWITRRSVPSASFAVE